MMQKRDSEFDVGVIVGRFQVDRLTDGHIDLIKTVCNAHDKVVVVLGLSPLLGTTRNPLDYEARKQMILSVFPDVNVLYLKDVPSDELWSQRLDAMIHDLLSPSQNVLLYGSRDSFIEDEDGHAIYSGKFPTMVLEATSDVSASERREQIRRRVTNLPAFREGVIWSSLNRYPTAFSAVDIAIWNEEGTKLLLGRKKNETEFRFIGGFVDPKDTSKEAAARREASEETKLSITDPVYVASHLVDDWRYRSEVDKIMTTLFECKVQFGRAEAGDDIVEVRWFDFNTLQDSDIRPEHRPLLEILGRKSHIRNSDPMMEEVI